MRVVKEDFIALGMKHRHDVTRVPSGYAVPTLLAEVLPSQAARWHLIWSAEWVNGGMPMLTLSHTYAAALMSTAVPQIEIRPPWPFFLLAIPDGLVSIAGPASVEPVELVLVAHCFNPSQNRDTWSVSACGETVILDQFARDTETFAKGELDGCITDSAFHLGFDSRDARCQHLVSRCVLNACVAASDPMRLRQLGKHGRGGVSTRRPGELPKVRAYVLGSPVSIDCREAIRSYMDGAQRSTGLIQWLVRGHWRNQAHGPGNALRRMKWIEPYWKGPEDGPINVRQHELDGAST